MLPLYYFAYGSNMSSAELKAHCPSAWSFGMARVDGWRLAFTRHSDRRQGGVADIVRERGASVWGVLWEIAPDDLPALHAKEGFQPGRESALNVYEPLELVGWRMGSDTQPHKAFAYAVVEKQAGHVPPHADYADIIRRGALEHELPQEYIAQLEALFATAAQTA